MNRILLSMVGWLMMVSAFADTSLVVAPSGGVDQYRSTSKIGTQPDTTSCWNANKADAEARKVEKAVSYGCDPRRETGTITYSKPAMPQMPGIMVDPAKIPPPNPVATREFRVRPATEPVRLNNTDGKFRLGYQWSHFNNDDPIVLHGQPGKSHLHLYFGAAGVNAFTTAESLKNCASTAAGGSAVCSAIWMPALLMPDLEKKGNWIPVKPIGGDFYWSTGFGYNPPEEVQWPPNGLMAIGGALPTNTDPSGVPRGASWVCFPDGIEQKSIPDCPGQFVLNVGLPNCWDGKNLDSPDHRSHLSYVGDNGKCPASHPVAITEVSFHVWFEKPPGIKTSDLRLSCDRVEGPGGLCLHVDFIEQVNEGIRDESVDTCIHKLGSCQNTTGKRELY